MGLKVAAQQRSSKFTSPANGKTASTPLRSRAPASELQRAIGNFSTTRLLRAGHIQPKLTVSNPNDQYEREADRVADQVMRMPDGAKVGTRGSVNSRVLHRKCACDSAEQACAACKGESVSTLQRSESNRVEPKLVPGIVHEVLRSPGQSLDSKTREFMEPRFNFDFSGVRVHSDGPAAASARSIHARAYTSGRDVVFGAGEYAPQSAKGKLLLAHELAHVAQQNGDGAADIQRQMVERTTPAPQTSPQSPTHQTTASGTTPAAVAQPTGGTSSTHAGPHPPLYWGRYAPQTNAVAISRFGATLENIAEFLYGTPLAAIDLASLNGLQLSIPLSPGTVVRTTGEDFSSAAAQSLKSARLLPANCGDPDQFVAKKKVLDTSLESDFNTIVGWINRGLQFVAFALPDSSAIVEIFRKWGEEKFTEYPWAYPNGGDYLDRLFHKLYNKTKILSGIFTDEWTNYYSLLFNHFDRGDKIAAIRDRNAKVYRGDKGIAELSFASMFWEDIKSGAVRDRIIAYGRGLAKGAWSGLKGTAKFAYTLVTDPGQAWEDLKKVPGAVKSLWNNRAELWNSFVNASPEEQAEMIGKFFGELEFAIASGGATSASSKAITKAAELPGLVGSAAKVLDTTLKLPSQVLGGAAKVTKTIVFKGVGFAAEGAKWAAKGVIRLGNKILRGTWSVVEEAIGAVTSKFYYFYDEAAGVLRKIEEKIAKLFVKCTDCKLTKEAKELARQQELDLIEKHVAAGKVKKVDYVPPSGIADEAEGILVGATGESMIGADQVLRRLLAHSGTAVHQQVYRLLKSIQERLPLNAVFTEKMWPELERALGITVPSRGRGLDIVVLDYKRKILSGVDITRRAGVASHVQKGMEDLARLRALLAPKGWKVAEQLLEPAWKGRTPQAIVDELVAILNKLAGGS